MSAIETHHLSLAATGRLPAVETRHVCSMKMAQSAVAAAGVAPVSAAENLPNQQTSVLVSSQRTTPNSVLRLEIVLFHLGEE